MIRFLIMYYKVLGSSLGETMMLMYSWQQYVVVDRLSQLESSEAGDGVCDKFLDVELFKVIVEVALDGMVVGEDKWLTNMHRVIVGRVEPGNVNNLWSKANIFSWCKIYTVPIGSR